MTAPTPHAISQKKHDRGPFREPLWTPRCNTCGVDLSDQPIDSHDAKEAKFRHQRDVAVREVAG